MRTVSSDLISEFEPHHFSAEASDLGLRPGEWPEMLDTNIGNTRPFVRSSKRVDPDGDLMWVTYRQVNGCVLLRIYND